MSVCFDVLNDKVQGLFIVIQQVEFFYDFYGFLLQHPFQQGVDVLKMIIKGLSVYIAVGDDFADCDFF